MRSARIGVIPEGDAIDRDNREQTGYPRQHEKHSPLAYAHHRVRPIVNNKNEKSRHKNNEGRNDRCKQIGSDTALSASHAVSSNDKNRQNDRQRERVER